MNNDSGGSSPSERQRQTAAAIARRKVLDAYGDNGNNTINKNKQTSKVKPSFSKAEWHRYHSGWQQYYQKYYGEYYAKAAQNYIAAQKMRATRQQADDKRLLGEDGETLKKATEENSEQPINKLNKKFTKLSEHIKDSHRRKRFIPILIGAGAVLILLFLQFNRLLFAPLAAYVSPGNNEASSITPVDGTVTQQISAEPKLIIPKLNINVPVDFDISNDSRTMMDAMNRGVAQFKIPGASAMPGEIGNLIITGHSAGDLYSSNPYKFIFSGLERLTTGDNIYINYNSKRYTYSVTTSEVVSPSDVAALTKTNGKPQLILVTCTPLGTSRYRLLLHADQISPSTDSFTPTAPASTNINNADTSMPSNEPTFFEAIWNFLTGNNN